MEKARVMGWSDEGFEDWMGRRRRVEWRVLRNIVLFVVW